MARKQPVARNSPAVIRKFKRVLAVGCSHGDLASKERQAEVLAFKRQFDPQVIFELGDVMDTAAFRSGARGTIDESKPIESDNLAAIEWLRLLQPTHVAWGNHDWRLVEWQGHHNAALSYAASMVWRALQQCVTELGAKTVPYDIEDGWFYEGGVFWGHGFMYNEQAVRDHAEMLGGRVVMAHLHVPQAVPGRTLRSSDSFCVGTLAELKRMNYARRRRATTRWSAGAVFGEMCKEESVLWLARGEKNEPIQFPKTF